MDRTDTQPSPPGAIAATQILEIREVPQGTVAGGLAERALARRTRQTRGARVCPHCKGNDVVLHGNDQNGRQRFHCRGCYKTYNILTGTPMARARKPEKWEQYLGCMTEHMSVRKIVASGIGVHQVTAWRWRHRFLQAAANDNTAVLSGVVEAGTAFFRRSFKGSRGQTPLKLPAAKPESSFEHVTVLTALDRNGGVLDVILMSLAEIEAALHGRIAAGSVLRSDDSAAYVRVAARAGARHSPVLVLATKQPPATINRDGAHARTPGWPGLRLVNNYHRLLKYLIDERCRGVATKYLWHYLGWHRAMARPGFQGAMLLDRALH